MKNTLSILLIFLAISSNSLCQSNTKSLADKPYDLNRLIKVYDKLLEEKTDRNERSYFSAFPGTFTTFVDVFGYKSIQDDIKKGPLYDDAQEYINSFFELRSIPDEDFMRKIIGISEDGKWDADAVNYFSMGLTKLVERKTKKFIQVLGTYKDQEVYAFWRFFFDGPHPIKDIPEYLLPLEETNKSMYMQISKALKDTQDDWEEGH